MSSIENTNQNAVDYAALVSKFETEITEKTTKQGEYLPWTFYKNDVIGLLGVLCKDGNKVTTNVLRQYLIQVLEQRVESMPKGRKVEAVRVNHTIIEMTQKDHYEMRRRQLDLAKKSTVSGATITRILGGKGAREYIHKNGFKYESGFWSAVTSDVKKEADEEKSS